MRGTIMAVIGFITLALAAGQLHARVNPSSASARSTPADATRLAIAKANALMGQEEWKAAVGQFAHAIDSAGFDGLSDDEQYTALIRAAGVAIDLEDAATAHRWLLRATVHPRSSNIDWHRRLSSAYALGNYADSAVCIATLARRWPDTLGEINARAIWRAAGRIDIDATLATTQREFLDSLFDARWTDDGVAPDDLWLDLVRLHLTSGDIGKAGIVARRIAAPRSVLALLIDKRYDAVTTQQGFNRDIDQVAATALLRAEARVRAAPDRLDRITGLQVLLLEDRQFARVLALSDEVIAKAANGDGGKSYADFNDTYPWILDYRARALQGLGRWDEALAQRRKAARRPQDGGPNVSQALNLGMLYAELDRPADALEMLDELGGMSEYGRMVQANVALRASVTLGDSVAIEKHMDYLREHRAEAVGGLQDALLTTGATEAAADLLIERLRNDRWRSDALLLVQDYADVPLTPWRQRYQQRLGKVLAVPRVQAELARAGRVMTLKLGPPLR